MDSTKALALCLIVGYWIVLLVTRWMFIARPNRRFTLARIQATQYRMTLLDDGQSRPGLLVEARDIVNAVDDRFEPAWLLESPRKDPKHRRWRRWTSDLWEILVWNGSRDLVAWHLLHEVKVDCVEQYKSTADLRARLTRAQSDLGELGPVEQQFWRSKLEDVLSPPHPAGEPTPSFDETRARSMLHEYLRALYAARDTKFVNLATQQNKVTWLILVALVTMAALVLLDFSLVLLAGAIGGILSRLQRELVRRDVPSDYGVSWALMFLSPVAGALSAWAGLHVLALLQSLGVVDLRSVMPNDVDLTQPSTALFGLAIVLGTSERFLDRIVRQVTDTIAPEPDGPSEAGRSS